MMIKNLIYKSFHLIKRELVPEMVFLGRSRKFDVSGDFVRQSSLELCADEIYLQNIAGAIAELGVYKGDFARWMNQAFPDRKFYLFDTFEGFSKNDLSAEIQENFSKGNQDFSNTSVAEVLKKMAHPEQCVIKKGWFPSTAEGLDETFVFVSIDADLYQPILEGLKWFYPRLQPGGYIFIHDYNNIEYLGSKQAIKEFCQQNQLRWFPLSDMCGTAVILK